eukprot:UN01195
MKKGIKKYTTSLEALSNLAMTHMANPDDSDLEDPVIKTEGRHSLKRRVTRSVSRANTEQRKRSRKRRKRNTFTDLIDDELIGMINGDTDPKNGSHCLHKIEDEKYDEEQGRMLWKVRWSNQKKSVWEPLENVEHQPLFQNRIKQYCRELVSVQGDWKLVDFGVLSIKGNRGHYADKQGVLFGLRWVKERKFEAHFRFGKNVGGEVIGGEVQMRVAEDGNSFHGCWKYAS